MKNEKDYIQDIAEIRSMMERSSKFLSLSGWAGIMAGIYALVGAYIAYEYLQFNPDEVFCCSEASGNPSFKLFPIILLAFGVLILALATAVVFSNKKSNKKGEKLWNATARRLLIGMSVPLVAGGLLILIMIGHGLIGLIAPLTLVFYGIALYFASRYTYEEVKTLGLIQIGLGVLGCYFVEYGLVLWALGFGGFHIVYGIFMHYKYEK